MSPVERCEADNLRDCLDGTPLLSLDRCVRDVLARVAEQAVEAPALPVTTTH